MPIEYDSGTNLPFLFRAKCNFCEYTSNFSVHRNKARADVEQHRNSYPKHTYQLGKYRQYDRSRIFVEVV